MGPTGDLSAPDGLNVGPMNLGIRDGINKPAATKHKTFICDCERMLRDIDWKRNSDVGETLRIFGRGYTYSHYTNIFFYFSGLSRSNTCGDEMLYLLQCMTTYWTVYQVSWLGRMPQICRCHENVILILHRQNGCRYRLVSAETYTRIPYI